MNRYPLTFRHVTTVFGRGYVARVHLDGQALAEEDEESVAIYGVHPGAIAEVGRSVKGAFQGFADRLRLYYFDVANDAADFDAFRSEVERFFRECDDETIAEWESARAEVRAGRVELAGVPRDANARAPGVEVTLVVLEPAANRVEKRTVRPLVAA